MKIWKLDRAIQPWEPEPIQLLPKPPDRTLIVNQTWMRNVKRECADMSKEMLDELLTGIIVVNGTKKDLESED